MRRLLWLLPVALSLSLWALGSSVALYRVLRSDEFVMVEVRRYGLIGPLAMTLSWFALPYLAAGLASAWAGRGLVRLSVREPAPPGIRDGALGSVLLAGFFAASTLIGLVERPALFAGMFHRKGGQRAALQLLAERIIDPGTARAWSIGLAVVVLGAAGAGWWLRSISRRRRQWGLGALLMAGLAVLAAAMTDRGFAALRGIDAPASPDARAIATRPNMLVILIDSLRAVPFDPPPGETEATPRLDAFARQAARFTDARTPLARTYASVASLLTGKHPLRHGIRTLYPERAARRLADPTLPRLLASRGWTTIAVGGYCATALRELDTGFVVQRTPRSEADLILSAVALQAHPLLPVWLRSPLARSWFPQLRTAIEGSHPADVAREAARAWRASPSPFFETVFFDNPHLPYVPTWPDCANAGPYSGPNRYSLTEGSILEQVRQGEGAPNLRRKQEELRNARRLYANAVRSVDRSVGELLEMLSADGLESNTIVLILADHGENLLDEGGPLAHGEAIERDRSTSVPLLMRWPGRIEPRTLPDAVTLMDVAPTLLDLLGLDIPSGLDGVSLAARLAGGPALPDRPVLFEVGEWFFARETVDRLDPSGRGIAYPDFDKGLLEGEPGDPVHIVIAPAHREALLRAKQRRIELGPWALAYLPRNDGAAFHLFRRDLDPWLTNDISADEPGQRRALIDLFYTESARLGDRSLMPPAPGER